MEVLDATAQHHFETPAKKIHNEDDLRFFLSSKAYSDIMTFLVQLNTAMVPRKLAAADPAPAQTSLPTATSALKLPPPRRAKAPIQTWEINSPEISFSAAVTSLGSLISELESFIDEAPPDPGPRRFGNVSFRKWYSMVEERASALLNKYLILSQLLTNNKQAMDEVRSYFLGSFGSAARLDYGTGHELSFLAFLGAVWKLGGFSQSESRDGQEERGIVVGVIVPYLQLMRRLISTYTLEPAGSHGVWGLDDHFFLPYIFGSAQYAPAISAGDPAPLQGSRPGAPRPDDVIKPAVVERERAVNLYFGAIGFVYDVKRGPFWEHSPQLYDISGVKDGWGKINKGLIKMYVGEVLSKFPVVQHFPFGALFKWERDANVPVVPASALAPSPARPGNVSGGGSAVTGGPSAGRPGATVMPTASSGAVSGTAAPWAAAAAPGNTSLRAFSTASPATNAPRPLPTTLAQLGAREGFRRDQYHARPAPPPTRPPSHQ